MVLSTRRDFIAGTGACLAAGAVTLPADLGARERLRSPFERKLADIEQALGARLGVAVIDTGSGRRWTQRSTERFPMCSTFKVLASGAILARVDRGVERLDRRIVIEAADLVTYSPVTEKRVGGDGMTIAELCEAAITRSDNTAGNLLLARIGGPPGVTAFARTMGDAATRLDRWETALNEATPGDPRDTTTPASMANDLRTLVLGNRLSTRSRAQLTAWLVGNQTGGAKLRAGLPADWRVGDKTGGGDHGAMNDIAVIWPPARAPLVACVFMTETGASFDDRNAAIAQIARSLVQEIGA